MLPWLWPKIFGFENISLFKSSDIHRCIVSKLEQKQISISKIICRNYENFNVNNKEMT